MDDSKIKGWALRSFRPAPRASARRNVAKTLGQSFVFWILFLGLIPAGLARLEGYLPHQGFRFPTQEWSPWILFALAGCVAIASGVTMATRGRGTPLPLAAPRKLVVAGPYRLVRNPMAVAGLVQGACVGAALGSYLILVYVVVGGVLWNAWVRPLEEIDLEARFGDDFVDYRAHVRCWIPRLTPYRASAGKGLGSSVHG